MKLYVANVTKQIQEIWYRVAEIGRPIRETIGIGQQIRVFKEDANTDQIESIIKQLEVYGLRPVTEAKRLRERVTFLWQLDKPMTAAQIEGVMEHNDRMLLKRADEIRQDYALAADAKIQEITRGHGRLMDMEFEEVTKGTDPADRSKQKIIVNERAA